MEVYATLSREQVYAKIPYSLICETMGSARWNTGKRMCMWNKEFTEAERRKCYDLYKIAMKWHLVKGVPEKVKMTTDTLGMWLRLGEFCAAL